MKKILFVSVTFITLLVLTQKDAIACECWYLPKTLEQGIKDRLKTNKAVFSGKVIAIDKTQMTHAMVKGGSEIPILLVKIKVAESWKGVLPEEITITTLLGDCGYPFQIGKSYLVFAFSSDKNNLRTGPCSENKEIEKATEELKILGKGKRPRKS